MKAYSMPQAFPQPLSGSFDAVGLDIDTCFDRYAKYGPYGFDDEENHQVPGWERPIPVEWEEVNWGLLQQECLVNNYERYSFDNRVKATMRPSTAYPTHNEESFTSQPGRELSVRGQGLANGKLKPSNIESGMRAYQQRTAVLVRTWTGYSYTPNDVQAIRSMVAELSLLS